MKIVVLGATGNVGTAVLRRLHAAPVDAGNSIVQWNGAMANRMGKAVGLSGTLPVAVNVATTACINEPPPR